MPVGRPKGSKTKNKTATPKMPQIQGPGVLQNQVSSTGRKGGAAGTLTRAQTERAVSPKAGRKTGSSRAQGSSAGMQGNLPGWDSQQYAAMLQQHQQNAETIKAQNQRITALERQVSKMCTAFGKLGLTTKSAGNS